MTYGSTSPAITPELQRLRQRRHRVVAHDQADLLDHGHRLQPGARLAVHLVVLGAVDPNYAITYVPGDVSR